MLSTAAAPYSPSVSDLLSPSDANNDGAAVVLNRLLHAKAATRHKLHKCVTWWRSVMSQSHVIKGGTPDEAFEEQCF